MSNPIYQAATLIVPLILAIVFHEVAHGWTARMLGDPTAARMGRLSLNPLRHVDWFGTVILPGMLALVKAPILGWAKPVPVNPRFFAKPRNGMMLVGAAGPASNLVMAALAAVALGLMMRAAGQGEPSAGMRFVAENLVNFLSINVFLAFFNLLPLPPFDGSHIVEGLLPEDLARTYGALRRYGMSLILLLIVVLPALAPQLDIVRGLVFPPVDWATGHYLALARVVAG